MNLKDLVRGKLGWQGGGCFLEYFIFCQRLEFNLSLKCLNCKYRYRNS